MSDDQLGSIQRLQNLNKSAEIMGMQHTEDTLSEQKLATVNSVTMHQNMTPEDLANYQVRQALVEQMLLLSDGDLAEVANDYKSLADEVKEKKDTLTREANASGKEKLKNDFFATKRRAARKKLSDIEDKKKTYNKHMEDQKLDDEYLDKEVRLSRFDRSKKKIRVGSNSRGPIATYMVNVFNDKEVERRKTGLKPGEEKERPGDFAPQLLQNEKIEFPGPDGSTLRGYRFPADRRFANGKTVILYTGSGQAGMMERGMGTTVMHYVNMGYQVFQMDYRGYGESGTKDKKGKFKSEPLSEKRFYEDGDAIFQGVKNLTGASNSDIIVHGYSMGGAIASHVMAKVAEENARKAVAGERVDPIGGIVMDSAMKSLQYAATDAVGSFAGKIAKWAAGDYSAEDHLKIIAHYQPDTPILFVSGDKKATFSDGSPNEDQLTILDTNLHINTEFTHIDSFVKEKSGHMDCHIDPNVIQRFFGQQ